MNFEKSAMPALALIVKGGKDISRKFSDLCVYIDSYNS